MFQHLLFMALANCMPSFQLMQILILEQGIMVSVWERLAGL